MAGIIRAKLNPEILVWAREQAGISPEAAWSWGFEQGIFRDMAHARNAYDKLKRERKPEKGTLMRLMMK
jgi:hypothetical protein